MPARATSRDSPGYSPRYSGRAALVLAAWVVGAIPTVLGAMPCPVASIAHVACPGCGMTRAIRMLAGGDLGASLRMHPLALPSLTATALVMLATVGVTFARGTPIELLQVRAGRWAAAYFVIVNVALVLLWAMRMFGFFGGPVPVWND